MRYWYRDKDWIYVGFEYRPNLVEKMKRVFHASYNPAFKEWYFQPSLEKSLQLKYFLEANGFENKKPERKLEIELKRIEPLVNEVELKEMFDYIGLPLHLRDYQIEGVAYMINHGNCLNGCGPGVGKTRQSIALAELLNLFPCIVVCPATVKQSWLNEWKLCNPDRTVHVIDSRKEEDVDWKADVTIINYDYLFKRSAKEEIKEIKLRYSRSLTKKWKLAVLDEIHICKNPKSIRSKCVSQIVRNAEKTIGLSGTAIMNRPQELINILRLLGRFKEIFPDMAYYLYRYCAAKRTRFGLICSGASCTMELNKVIKHYCYFRKEIRDVVKELPPIIKQNINVPISNKKEYKKAEKDFIDWLYNIDEEAAERAIRAEQLVRLSGLKKLSIQGKTKFIVQFLREWSEANEDEKIIVFGITTEALENLHKEFSKNSEIVTGKCNTTEKLVRVERWKKEKTFLFANIASLSTGIDGLQKHCYNMAFIELPQRPAELEQATGRIDRMGQKESMNVYFLLSNETVDMQIRELLDEKIVVTDAVNKGKDVQISSDNSMDIALINKLKEWKEKK